ncbi:hypothetical protein Tco_0083393 [Tanacetum coccineum]
MECFRENQPTTIHSAILKVGILTDEAVCCGTLTRSSEKRKEMEETSKQGGSWKDNKKAKWEKDLWRQLPLEMKIWAHILSVLSVLPIIQKVDLVGYVLTVRNRATD